ncbi:MAG: trypsin-like peptidase domain-containing protein [Candidatus Hydrogenedentes bacterium]|nr:trypsin-like peptidase domain-containing protein [Candidatus Hydrogenedentota bacterium]
MKNSCLFSVFLVLAYFASVAGAADDGCGECNDGSPVFADAAVFLASKGYPTDEYDVLLTWDEAASKSSGNRIHGFHVLPKAGGTPFDLYSDGEGNLLEEGQLTELGVAPKDWQLKPVEAEAELPLPVAKALPPRPRPKSVPGAASVLELPGIDLATVLAEDDAREQQTPKGPKRVGLVIDLPEAISVAATKCNLGTWQPIAGGTLWSVRLSAPEALGMRIHFSTLSLPTEAQVSVYNTANPNEAYGPFTEPYGLDSDLWSPSCFSDDVTIECFVPVAADGSDLHIVIDKIVHIYHGFSAVQWAKGIAGSCNLDVSCYPAWSTAARGVGLIGTIALNGLLFCTGSLIVDTDTSSQIPYFLTANHCVGGQTGNFGASNIEVYWLYQRSSCPDGAIPNVADVPRTIGGADYLAGSNQTTGNDFTFLRLRNAAPAEIPFLGWSSDAQALGLDAVCIHHPQTDYKRITFGNITDRPDRMLSRPANRFYEMTWKPNLGTTEPGSSGSPLFRETTQQIIGQLWGGLASCNSPDKADYYGRFDVTFPVIAQYLTPVPFAPEDVDHSGSVNANDVQLVINAALGIPIQYNADVNKTGVVDAVDVQRVINAALGLT